MVNAIEAFDAKHMKPAEEIPAFRPGDTVEVNVVRKISFGTGVERRFPLHSPVIDSIKVVRKGRVRRAKLYYLRNLRGKAARIVERRDNSEK